MASTKETYRLLSDTLIISSIITSIWICSENFTDSNIIPKWLFCSIFILLIIIFHAVRLLLQYSFRINILSISAKIIFIVCLQAGYGILQSIKQLPFDDLCAVTGSFDNPAGFASCLCFGLPFASFLLPARNKYVRYAGWLAIILIVTAVVLSASRAGIISMAAMGVAYLHQRTNGKHRMWKYGMWIAVVLLFIGCYWIKKDSADGRLLIGQCSLEMAMDAPLLGHGLNSFEAHYMDYQAAYFEEHGQQSRFAMLADNVKHPFNEYLHVLLNFGLIGWAMLAGLIVWLIRCYRAHPCREKQVAAYVLLAVGTFSLFSYPFTYPFTWIVTLLSVGLLAREPIQHFFDSPKMRYALCAVALIGSLVGTYQWVERVRAEWKWDKASRLALGGKCKEALPLYRDLEDAFDDNAYFLYNYAAVLQESKRYAESLNVALRCRRYWADYDLEMILGENYRHLGKPQEAEEHYRLASSMCPSRFLPLYKLFHLYKENGDEAQMKEIADAMEIKPIKIKTATIRMMKREVKKEMDLLHINRSEQ